MFADNLAIGHILIGLLQRKIEGYGALKCMFHKSKIVYQRIKEFAQNTRENNPSFGVEKFRSVSFHLDALDVNSKLPLTTQYKLN